MKTALFISPHLDDVAFSCGGALIELARQNWETALLTVFTRSVPNPSNFALACQLDKNLSAEVDYMKLRRAEDLAFANLASVSKIVHLDLPEAPNRGYNSAPELFAGIKTGDEIWLAAAEQLKQYKADAVFAPQGIGNHVDHLQTIKAVLHLNLKTPIFWYKDTPYAIHFPDSRPADLLPTNLLETAFDVSGSILKKVEACCAYATQIGFQFGGAEKLKTDLLEFHRREAVRTSQHFRHAEVFLI